MLNSFDYVCLAMYAQRRLADVIGRAFVCKRQLYPLSGCRKTDAAFVEGDRLDQHKHPRPRLYREFLARLA